MSDLDKLQKMLPPSYFTFFRADNTLCISEDKSLLPFVFVILDENFPTYFVLSYAIEYPRPDRAAEIALFATKLRPTILMENFYVSRSGVTYYGNEAEKYWDIDTHLPIEEIEPENDNVH